MTQQSIFRIHPEIQNRINKVINLYTQIQRIPNQYKEIAVIGKPIRWLLSDQTNQYVSIKKETTTQKILDIDITSCFPSLCRYLFSDIDDKFLEKMDSIEDKKEKNKFISINKTDYLKIFNLLSKMIIFGFIFDRQDSASITLLEFEKDGCVVFTESLDYIQHIQTNLIDTHFLSFILTTFQFHIKEIEYYIRCNNTSIIWKDNKLTLKGIYKHAPKKIEYLYNNIFNGHDVNKINKTDLIQDIYKDKTFKVIRMNNLTEILSDYYICSNNKVLNSLGKYEEWNHYKSQIDPSLYLTSFVNPIVLFTRI